MTLKRFGYWVINMDAITCVLLTIVEAPPKKGVEVTIGGKTILLRGEDAESFCTAIGMPLPEPPTFPNPII